MSHQDERPFPAQTTEVGEAEEVERVWLAKTAPCAFFGGIAPKFDHSRFVRVQFQGELRQSLPQMQEQPFGVFLLLKANQEVIGITHDDHLAGSVRVQCPSVQEALLQFGGGTLSYHSARQHGQRMAAHFHSAEEMELFLMSANATDDGRRKVGESASHAAGDRMG